MTAGGICWAKGCGEVLLRRDRGDRGALEQVPDDAGPPRWLQLAHDEIEVRAQLGAGSRLELLDRRLQMEARLKHEYPGMPLEVRTKFNARLQARGYTEGAWGAAVAWLELTDWFRLGGRYLGDV